MCSLKPSNSTPFADICSRWAKNPTRGEIVSEVTVPPRRAETAAFPSWLPPKLVAALKQRGISSPYAHQAAAWRELHHGRNTVIATPTASGKTLCYNVPVLSALAQSPQGSALYLFPTKALSRDQEESIVTLASSSDIKGKISVYDGDTPSLERRAARSQARLIITNPDMLHTGILPHHASWASFLTGLSFVVIDELHMYRGVFGSHVANVLRRLLRVAAFYQAKPTFAASSATIANPRQLAEKITGQPFTAICRSSAPEGPRRLTVFNPAVVDGSRGIRRSVLKEAAKLAVDLIRSGIVSLIFCQTRRGVELVLHYIQTRIAEHGMDPDRIRGYRGGYLPNVRRGIEVSLRNGELDAVVATNALELGIDIGSLDAVVMAGYPGTIAGFRQRGGRAGRRLGPSLVVLVTSANPLDQFLARQPQYLFENTPECALVQPDNVDILLAHLRCAAFELPFPAGEAFGSLSVPDTQSALAFLNEEADLSLSKNRYHYIGESYPAADVSLRNIRADRVVVIDQELGQAIAEVDMQAARMELHEQAIYLSEGQTYLVHKLDLVSHQALVQKVDPTYYTKPMSDVVLTVEDEREIRPFPGGVARLGDVQVTEKMTGFKKIRFHSHENLGYGEVHLPEATMETESFWLTPSSALMQALRSHGEALQMRAMSGLGHAVHQVAVLHLMCDPRDVAFVAQTVPGSEGNGDESAQMALFFYDNHPGGVGLSEQAFQETVPILEDARQLIEGCGCKSGCPSCVGPLDHSSRHVKESAVALACGLIGFSSPAPAVN